MASYDIYVKLVDQTRAPMNKIQGGLKNVADQAKKTEAAVAGLNKGIQAAGLAASAAFAIAVKSSITYAAKINDATAATGIAQRSILALGNALAVNGGQAAKASQAAIEFGERLGAAALGAGEQANALYALGLSYEDIIKLKPQDQFNTVIQALAGVESQTQAAKLATALFADTMKGVNVKGLAADYNRMYESQKDVAEATKSIGQASDTLNAAWVRLQGNIAKAIKPAADFVNKLSPEQLDRIISAITQLAVALAGFTVATKVIAAVAGSFLLFKSGATLAAGGVAMMGKSLGSLGTTAAITYSVLKNYAAPAWITAIKNGSGLLGQMALTFATLGKRISFALQAVGGLGGAVVMLGKGFVRMIPFVGQLIGVLLLANEAVAAVFKVDLIDKFIGKLVEAWGWMKKIVGLGDKPIVVTTTAADFQRTDKDTTPVPTPPKPTPTNKYVEEAKRAIAEAEKNLEGMRAGLASAGNENIGAAIFGQMASEAEKLGIVLQKPTNLINRDFRIAVEGAKVNLEGLRTVLANADDENIGAAVFGQMATEAEKLGIVLEKPINLIKRDFRIAVESAKENLKGLRSVLASASDENIGAAVFGQMASEAEKLGIVLEKPTNLINRDFRVAVENATEAARQHAAELKNTALVEAEFFAAISETTTALEKNAMKLGNAAVQQVLFLQGITSSRQETQQQTITQDLLNAAFSAGTISSREYIKGLQGIDEQLLSVNEKTAMFVDGLRASEKAWGDNFLVADNVTNLYKSGALTLKELELAVSQLGEEYFNYNELLKINISQANKAVASDEKQAAQLRDLTQQFKAGAVAADVYAKAAGNLGGDSESINRLVNVYGKAKDQIIQDNIFIKKSISSAANTFSTEFTDAIMKGQFSLSSFKNFTTNILNDIAQRIIKRQFADPIATALEEMAMKTFGKGGIIPTTATEGAVTATDSMTNIFQGLAGKTSDIFSGMSSSIKDIFGGMGDSLMSGLSSVFSWIMDGIGSIGSSFSSMGGGGGGGGIFGSIAGMFSGGGGGFFDSISSAFGGFFADGGSLGAGQWGVAGENGPEIISGPANITPTSNGGDGSPLVVNFSINAVDTQTGTEFLIKNKAVITNVIEQAYNRRGKRGPVTA